MSFESSNDSRRDAQNARYSASGVSHGSSVPARVEK